MSSISFDIEVWILLVTTIQLPNLISTFVATMILNLFLNPFVTFSIIIYYARTMLWHLLNCLLPSFLCCRYFVFLFWSFCITDPKYQKRFVRVILCSWVVNHVSVEFALHIFCYSSTNSWTLWFLCILHVSSLVRGTSLEVPNKTMSLGTMQCLAFHSALLQTDIDREQCWSLLQRYFY